jgi:hypothetical protein
MVTNYGHTDKLSNPLSIESFLPVFFSTTWHPCNNWTFEVLHLHFSVTNHVYGNPPLGIK